MKIKTQIATVACCFWAFTAIAQNTKTTTLKDSLATEEVEPSMFRFEPDYAESKLKQREELRSKIRALDTLPISEKKRERLIKALYKDLNSEKFKKTILANTKYEDEEE